jgi:acyl carrier protein
MERQDIVDTVRNFVLTQFLSGEDPDELADDAPLMTTGILDSVAASKLVTFLEQEFEITLEAHEADADSLDTIDQIVDLVNAKF